MLAKLLHLHVIRNPGDAASSPVPEPAPGGAARGEAAPGHPGGRPSPAAALAPGLAPGDPPFFRRPRFREESFREPGKLWETGFIGTDRRK